MANLQDRIKHNQQYFRSMEIIENTLIIKVTFPKRWATYNSDTTENALIKVAKSEEEANTWFYYATIDQSSFDDIFDLIEGTIQTNLDAFAKVELLKEKVEELKQIFEHEPLDRLKKLEFKLPKERKKNSKKIVSEPLSQDEQTTTAQEEINPTTNQKIEE